MQLQQEDHRGVDPYSLLDLSGWASLKRECPPIGSLSLRGGCPELARLRPNRATAV